MVAAGVVLSPGAAPAAEAVRITEFMAVNTRGLTDRDREHSDWIELYNSGSTPVNLEGWSLTDDRTQLTKWKFPAIPLGPDEYLLVFASKKDRRQPGSELHTNFKLDATKGYLALVKPDGESVANDFGRSYPRQQPNVSFGLDMSDQALALVGAATPCRWTVPGRDPGANWAAPAFDDKSWTAGTNALRYRAADQEGAAQANANAPAAGPIGSAYLRVPFQLPAGAASIAVEALKLKLNYSDGFIAYLNGREVARRNVPERTQWNSTALSSRPAQLATALVEPFDAVAGNYATAQLDPSTKPRALRAAEGETNGFLRLINGHQTNQVGSIAFPNVVDSLSDSTETEFDFRWRGSGDGTQRLVWLLIPSSAYGPRGSGIDLTAYRESKDPKFASVLAVQLLHNMENGQKALTVFWDRVRRATVPLSSVELNPGAFHHAKIRLRFAEVGAWLDVTLQSGSQPGRAAVPVISQLLIPGMRAFAGRIQFAGRIGHWDQTIDLDNVRIECVPQGQGSMEEFDLAAYSTALRPGANVLAIQALAQAGRPPEFVLQPELSARLTTSQSKDGRYFPQPTPRARNREGLAAAAPPPAFSRRGGVFTNTFSLELSTDTGQVHYTLDGSEPTTTSPVYTQPIPLTGSALVQARTFATGLLPSPTTIETYTFLDERTVTFSSNLPLLILNPFGQYLSANSRSTVSVRFIDTANGRSWLGGPADFDGRASVNLRGFSTLRQPKNSLTARLKDGNDDKVKTPLLGLPKESDWVLYAPYSDKTLMRDVLAYELSNKMGRYAPRTRFIEVFIDRSGGKLSQRDYMGLYVLIEKIKRDKNRVSVAEINGSDLTEPNISGGYIFKRDHSERWEPSFRTSRGQHFYYVDPKPEGLTREQTAWLTHYMNRFEQALYGAEFRDPSRGYAAFLDVDSFIDQHWLIELSKNIDGFRYSAFLHKDRGGKLQMGPAWDWNLSFGNADYHDGSDPTGWYYPLLRESELCWFRRLNEDPDFAQRAIDRWGELRRSVFAPGTILKRVDEIAALLQESQARNFSRWQILGRRVNPNDFVGATYAEEIRWMKQWIQKRIAWIDGQFLMPPNLVAGSEGAKRGEPIVLKTASGKILYTLDGSDPRLPGGGVSPKAAAYSAPVTLKPGAKLFARAHNRNDWSSPTVVVQTSGDRAGR